MGINLKCASCHDSFIDRWTLKDAYGLAAVYADAPLELHRCDKPTGEKQSATWLFPEIGSVDDTAPRDQRLKQLAGLMTHPDNGRFSRTIVNRLWHRMMGHGLVHPLDAMQTRPWNEDLLDHLANHLADNSFDLKSTLRYITESAAYQSVCDTHVDDQEFQYRGPLPKRMTAEQFLDAVWQVTETSPSAPQAPMFRSTASKEAVENVTLSGKWIWQKGNGISVPDDEAILLRVVLNVPDDVVHGGMVITCDNEFTLYAATNGLHREPIGPVHNWLASRENSKRETITLS